MKLYNYERQKRITLQNRKGDLSGKAHNQIFAYPMKISLIMLVGKCGQSEEKGGEKNIYTTIYYSVRFSV